MQSDDQTLVSDCINNSKFKGQAYTNSSKFINVKGAIMIHDCIYQFLRLFYHSRFKPQQLEMTLTQLSAPVLDLVLVLPLILRLYKGFSIFSNARKLKIKSKSEINA